MPEFISILRWIRDIVYPQLIETNANVKIVADNIEEVKALNTSIEDGVMPFEKITTTTKTIDSLLMSSASNGDTVIVKDSNRGGTFVYDDTQSAVNNGGTVFDGWVRQFSGAVNVKWFGAVGDGVTDDTSAIQAAANLITNKTHIIDLANLSVRISTVNLIAAEVSVTVRNGHVTVVGAGAQGFKREKIDTNVRATYDVVFDNVHFIRAEAGGSCIYVSIAWQDETGGVHINENCSMNLTNGAVGLRLCTSFGSNLAGRYTMDVTSKAFVFGPPLVAPGDPDQLGPMEIIIDNAFFVGGTALDCELSATSPWNSFEGLSIGPGTRFYASKFHAIKYNSLKFNGCHGVAWDAVLDSGFNTTINGGYYDKMTTGGWLFKFKTTIRNFQGLVISGGAVLTSQGSLGDMVIFSDEGTASGAQITNVTIGDVYVAGGGQSETTPSRGIVFDHRECNFVSITSGLNFQNMYANLSFQKHITRSNIERFMSRECVWYAENVTTGFGGGYNTFDGIYKELPVELLVPNYNTTVAEEPIYNVNMKFGSMMRPPIATVTDIVSLFSTHFTIAAPITYRDGVKVELIKKASAPGGDRGGALATVILDASKYIAPL